MHIYSKLCNYGQFVFLVLTNAILAENVILACIFVLTRCAQSPNLL